MTHVKNTLILLALVGVVTLAAWLSFERERKARELTNAVDALTDAYNDSAQKVAASLPTIVNHSKYGISIIDGDTIIPIDMNEYQCWQAEWDKLEIYYQQTQQKIDEVKKRY